MDRKEAMKWTGDIDFKPGEIERMGTDQGLFANPQWHDFLVDLDKKCGRKETKRDKGAE